MGYNQSSLTRGCFLISFCLIMLPVRVLILSDDLLVRAGVSTLLAEVSFIEVLGALELNDLDLEVIEVYQPDTLLVPLRSTEATSISQIQGLYDSKVPLVIMTDEGSDLSSSLAIPHYVSIVLTNTSAEAIAAALHASARGLVVRPATSSLERVLPSSNSYDRLTSREQDVLELIAQGLTNKAIGQHLQIKESTVKFHVNSILTKLGAQSRTEAVVLATRLGWLYI
jgi:DNA-binding NarL/FixJ family response regulator